MSWDACGTKLYTAHVQQYSKPKNSKPIMRTLSHGIPVVNTYYSTAHIHPGPLGSPGST